jgi:hypothetical protein
MQSEMELKIRLALASSLACGSFSMSGSPRKPESFRWEGQTQINAQLRQARDKIASLFFF